MSSSPLPRQHRSDSKGRQAVDSNASPLRVYQVWEGRNKFFCGGRIIFGPDVKSPSLTLSLILAPMLLFWAFVARGLINAFQLGSVIVTFSVLLTAYILILLLLTSGRDPGIIPRNYHPPNSDNCDSSSVPTGLTSGPSSLTRSLAKTATGIPLTKNVMVNGTVTKVKYCQTCKIYRPPRCSHCSICDNCVERFDHHCPWVGQCIGKRNYRCFFMFVSWTSLLSLYILACCSLYMKRMADEEDYNFWEAIQRSPVSVILVLYTFVICWFIGGLTIFHLYLISTNQTTYENFRYRYEEKPNPYNLGLSVNCKEVFCTRIPRSRNNFRETVRHDPPEMENQQTVNADECEVTRSHICEPAW